MSATRIRAADKLAADIIGYVSGITPAGLGVQPETWEAMRAADDAIMAAIGRWERGEITYAELEEEGMRYVAAWKGVVKERKAAA